MTELYKHKNYGEYHEAQIIKNVRKIKIVWVQQYDIDDISNHIRKHIPNAKFGICHGVRNGWEVEQFRKKLGIEIIGTEISHTACQFDNVIQWDFHNLKDTWEDSVDFIYSNSFDHSHSPRHCLDIWMACIRRREGICYIHWSPAHNARVDAADCFGANDSEYRELFKEKYEVVDEFSSNKHQVIFAIKHQEE